MISVTTDVFCDDCGVWIHGTTGQKVRAREARSVAEAQGWGRTREGDFCPTCAAKRGIKVKHPRCVVCHERERTSSLSKHCWICKPR